MIRVAWAELARQGGRLAPKTLIALLLVGSVIAGVTTVWTPEAPSPEAGLYRIKADADSPLIPAAAGDRHFTFTETDWDLHLRAGDVLIRDNDRGKAAYQVLVIAVHEWQAKQLSLEADEAAAFPVSVNVAYEPRVPTAQAPPPPRSAPQQGPPPASDPPVLEQTSPSVVETALRPNEVDPPFPIRSLLLTFAYVLPASLLAQVHASNLHAERTRHRGVLLLSSPVGPGTILLGKSAPAILAGLAIAVVVSLILGTGFLGFLAAVAFLAFLFAATSALALISRTPRELSLLQVATTTLLNVFLFLPAMFPSIPAVAFLSPVHVVASGIRADPVTWGQFLYAVGPLSLGAAALSWISVGLLRDEILFSQGSTPKRLLGAVDAMTRTPQRILAAGAFVVPFVFAAQILVLVLASVLGLRAAFILWLPVSVLLEELAKGLPIWARRPTHPWRTAALVGTGFFLAEKGYLVLTLVGFGGLPFGDEALALLGTGPGVALLLIPLGLHIITAGMLAIGMTRGRPVLGLLAALAVHGIYDQVLLGGVL